MGSSGNSEAKQKLALLVGAVFVTAGFVRRAVRKPTAEDLERLAESRARDDEQSAQRLDEQKRAARARHLGLEYFEDGAEGRRLLDAETVTMIPIEAPFPDAQCSHYGSTVSSAQANAELSLDLDPRNGMGTVRLNVDRRTRFQQTFGHHPYKDADHLHLEGDDLEMFQLIARLLASMTRGFVGIHLRRTGWQRVREKIWVEYLNRNPAVAKEVGWPGSGRCNYL